MSRVTTRIVNLKGLLNECASFEVPSYQREYAWREEQYRKLFEDLKGAFEPETTEPPATSLDHYFVGTMLTRRQGEVLELIDGQQRSTCMMLLALAFKRIGVDSKIVRFADANDRFRINFPIRDEVQAYLDDKVRDPAAVEQWEEDKGKYEEVQARRDPRWHLSRTLSFFASQLEQLTSGSKDDVSEDSNRREAWSREKLIAFGDYLFEHVLLVNNEVPEGTDLESLFATMNNTGLQLEKHNILKALLLEKIEDSHERSLYESIWVACENMDNYFERNLSRIFSEAPFDVNFKSLDIEKLRKFTGISVSLKGKSSTGKCVYVAKEFSEIEEEFEDNIVALYRKETATDKNNKSDHDEIGAEYCRSIVSFPLLLLHALRIFRHQSLRVEKDYGDCRFHTDNLLKHFADLIDSSQGREIEGDRVKAFIECLWQVRFEFDRWVVKWVSLAGESDEHLMLQQLRPPSGSNSFTRDSEERKDAMPMLQSMRYFVSEHITQFWLTPFLGWLVACESSPGRDTVLLKMEEIDNALSLATVDQREASYTLLSRSLDEGEVSNFCAYKSYLQGGKGTSFKHYWFQKLEYILWKRDSGNQEKTNDRGFAEYRIVSRNSIEHVYPQNGQNGIKLDKKTLDDFGNLALLNVSQNSSYSDKFVQEKKGRFVNPASGYDSLKLKCLFDTLGDWKLDDGLDVYRSRVESHREEMLAVLEEHYRNEKRCFDG